MKYAKRGVMDCCECGRWVLLNDFGFCARCWSKLSDEQLRRLGLEVDGAARTITIIKPWPRGGLIFAACLIASVGTVFGLRWLGW